MGTISFRATVAVSATAGPTTAATTGDWLHLPEWAPDIDYIPTGALAANKDWVQFVEPTTVTTATTTLHCATGVGQYTARKVVLDTLAVAQYDKVTLCYREAGALVRT